MSAAVRRSLPLAAAGVALTAYLLTMYPGLVSIGDSPKFQFVGHIWGTPHNPGYPLYVVASNLFSRLPVGTLAYRMNLMSAVFGAITVGLVVLAIRRLTGSMLAAVGGALMLAFGRVFWSQAIIAEVYTLGSALFAAALCCLLRWADTRSPRDLLLAVAFVALAFGNHLTIVMVAPGLVLFVLATDWKAPLRLRVLLASAAIVLLGIAQYGLIVYWTSRQPAYLESSATNLRELIDVMRGAQFADRLFTGDARAVLVDRNAALAALLLQEMRAWGLALAAAGAIALVIGRRWRVAVLLLTASAGVWVFLLNYEMADPQVFLIPVFVTGAILAGVALGRFAAPLAARRRIAWRLAAGLMVLAPAAVLAATNYRANDHHLRTYETRLLDAVVRAVPDRSVIVPGTFADHLMLTYKLEGEHASRGGSIRRAEADPVALGRLWNDGVSVFAFPDARAELSRSGFLFEPVPLWDQPLPEILDGLPPGRIVAIAGLGLGASLPPHKGASLPQIGGREALFGRTRDDYAAVGVTGQKTGAVEAAGEGAAVRIDRGHTFETLPGGLPVSVEASSAGGGRIAVNGREIVTAPAAVAFLVLSADGRIVHRNIADPSRQLRVAFEDEPHLFRLVNVLECRDVANSGWQDISSMAADGTVAGRIDNYRPFDSRVVFVVSSDRALAPALAEWNGPGAPTFSVTPASAANLERVRFEGTVPPGPHSYLVEVAMNDNGESGTFTVKFGGAVRAAFALVSVDLNNPRRATLCSAPSI